MEPGVLWRSGSRLPGETVTGLTEDLKSATRQVRKNPRLLLLITVILGVGIGTNATIFSLIDAAARLPIQDQFTVILLWSVNGRGVWTALRSPPAILPI